MAIRIIRLLGSLGYSAVRCRGSGMWRAVSAYIEGRNAVRFERERRVTLLAVVPAMLPGTEIFDKRADGGTLRVSHWPAAGIDVIPPGHIKAAEIPVISLSPVHGLVGGPGENARTTEG